VQQFLRERRLRARQMSGERRRLGAKRLRIIVLPCLLVAAAVVVMSGGEVGAATPTSLTMTAGTFAVQHHAPAAVAVIATPVFTGNETTKTGAFTTGTFTYPTQVESNTGSKETILVYTAATTKVTASISTSGDLSVAATLTYEVHITTPVNEACKTEAPVHVVLSSTAPYTKTAKTVTVTNSTITIPTFSTTGCSLAASHLDKTFSGAGGELGLSLHGTLVVPSSAATTPAPSTTVLTASPASPQPAGTTVTLKATVDKSTGSPATAATGSMTFRNGTTTLGTATVSGGTASYSTKTLPAGTDSLTAVFSGGGGYAGSTSAPITYVVQSKPTQTKTQTCQLTVTLHLLTLGVVIKVCV
jgi:hypothetical protein